ncbi:MAG: HAMP domain-containing histidine kinase [Lachnospiraceae bacterium]|nr:HAMP domain-containing histidine kinase [Lachnospiraceae bacterium]
MKKWRTKQGTKSLAFFLSVLSALIIFTNGLFVMFMSSYGIYNEAKEDVQREWYKHNSEIYSVMALAERGSEGMRTALDRTHFRYGVIKANDVTNVDISNPDNYLCYNFGTMPTNDMLDGGMLQSNYFAIGDGTSYEWRCSPFGFATTYTAGSEYIEETATEEYAVTTPITGYYYDVDTGTFFYQTEDKFFRVNRVSIPVAENSDELLTFEYDSGQQAYYNLERDACIVKEYYVNFNIFDDTTSNWESWGYINLDGRDLTHTEIRFAHSDDIGEISKEYYVSVSDGMLTYKTKDADRAGLMEVPMYDYWVLHYVNETDVDMAFDEAIVTLMEGDLYEQTDVLLNWAYAYKYSCIIVLFIAAIIWIISTMAVLTTAGENEDGVKAGLLQKVPFDIASAVWFVLCGSFIAAFCSIYYSVAELYSLFPMALILFTAGYICGLVWLQDFVVRIKLGKIWRQTLVYKIYAVIRDAIKRAFSFLQENMPILWKVLLLYGVLCLGEAVVILFLAGFSIVLLLAWFIKSVVIATFLMIMTVQADRIKKFGEQLAKGDLNAKLNTNAMMWELKKHGDNLNQISEGMSTVVEERMQSERFKTELITNVSHDIKTPLTSIINYVDLLEKEEIDNPQAKEYLEVLQRQSARLKKLIEDLIEASKASTGSLSVNMESINVSVLLEQLLGEFQEKFEAEDLSVVLDKPEEDVFVQADGRHLWRVLDNLLNNICKYTYPGTRVYIDVDHSELHTIVSLKNISKYQLNIKGEELMERFVRGDASRHTEGSGLGLSIASSLMELMDGTLKIIVDGDLFKIELHF